jgi:hypothetical protein
MFSSDASLGSGETKTYPAWILAFKLFLLKRRKRRSSSWGHKINETNCPGVSLGNLLG